MLDKAAFFLDVVRSSSISKGAKKHNISTSTGSRWIQEMESELDTTLLVRNTRNVTLTDTGKLFFEEFSLISEQATKLITNVKTMENQMKGEIRIASTPLYSQRFLSGIIGEFLNLYPETTFKVIDTAFTGDYATQVDLTIRALATYRGHIERDSSLVKRLLLRYPLVTVCSPKYIEKYGKPTHPNQLINHNCLYTSTLVGGNQWLFEYNSEITTMKISQTVEIENSEFVKTVALSGGGIAYLPEDLVANEIREGHLMPILSSYTKSEFEFSLYFQPKHKLSARVMIFKEFLIKRTRELRNQALY